MSFHISIASLKAGLASVALVVSLALVSRQFMDFSFSIGLFLAAALGMAGRTHAAGLVLWATAVFDLLAAFVVGTLVWQFGVINPRLAAKRTK